MVRGTRGVSSVALRSSVAGFFQLIALRAHGLRMEVGLRPSPAAGQSFGESKPPPEEAGLASARGPIPEIVVEVVPFGGIEIHQRRWQLGAGLRL